MNLSLPVAPEFNENPKPQRGLEVEIPTMKSLFIEVLFGDKLLSTATAFLAANDQQSHCALITNRHVVTGRHQDTGECLSKFGAIPDNINIHFHLGNAPEGNWKVVNLPLFRNDGSPYWIQHPRLGAQADMVALNLNWGGDITKIPYYLKTTHDRTGILVGPAEPVSVIGFPFGLSSYGKFPVWATGFLAQELTLVTTDSPKFLIDCRTRQGQSGSPVIAHRTASVRRIQGDKIVGTLNPGNVWEFLGIYSGRVNAESDLGVVWHVSAIEELLSEAATEMQRRIQIASNVKA